MFDLPEDVSNKKYISTEPEPVGVSGEDIAPEENYSPIITPTYNAKKVTEKAEPRKKKVRGSRKSILTKDNLVKFIKYLKKKWVYFKTVQYPALYAKFYDIYYFELVPYKPIDIALKVLIILTLLIIVFIVLMILTELLRLIF